MYIVRSGGFLGMLEGRVYRVQAGEDVFRSLVGINELGIRMWRGGI